MPLSTDVTLPRDYQATFPQECINCRQSEFLETMTLSSHSIGWWTAAFFTPGRLRSVVVPVCSGCRWRVRMQRWGDWLVTILIAILVFALIWPLVDDWVPQSIRRWVVVALFVICALPYFIWTVFFPPAFDFTVYAKKIEYEFRDDEYAHLFFVMNEGNAEFISIE